MPFWFLDETPPETPSFGGYSYGLIDESNPAPKGAKVVETEKELVGIVEGAEKAFMEAIDKEDKEREKDEPKEEDKKTPPGQEGR